MLNNRSFLSLMRRNVILSMKMYSFRFSFGRPSLQVCLEERSVIRDLLAHLGIPTEKRGVTFINAKLSAMPGLQPDLDYVLKNNDRVAFFDLKSM